MTGGCELWLLSPLTLLISPSSQDSSSLSLLLLLELLELLPSSSLLLLLLSSELSLFFLVLSFFVFVLVDLSWGISSPQLAIVNNACGLSFLSTWVLAIIFTTSSPWMTWPNTTWTLRGGNKLLHRISPIANTTYPSKWGVGAKVLKYWKAKD